MVLRTAWVAPPTVETTKVAPALTAILPALAITSPALSITAPRTPVVRGLDAPVLLDRDCAFVLEAGGADEAQGAASARALPPGRVINIQQAVGAVGQVALELKPRGEDGDRAVVGEDGRERHLKCARPASDNQGARGCHYRVAAQGEGGTVQLELRCPARASNGDGTSRSSAAEDPGP